MRRTHDHPGTRHSRWHEVHLAGAAYLADKGYPDVHPRRIRPAGTDRWLLRYPLPDGELDLEVARLPDGWDWRVRRFSPR
jgi:hypothetical protein